MRTFTRCGMCGLVRARCVDVSVVISALAQLATPCANTVALL